MEINEQEKEILITACETEKARIRRSINATPNQAIKEILNTALINLNAFSDRLSNEPVRKVSK